MYNEFSLPEAILIPRDATVTDAIIRSIMGRKFKRQSATPKIEIQPHSRPKLNRLLYSDLQLSLFLIV